MKLGKKNLIYSLILAILLLGFLVGYFIYMLPSLYVNYSNELSLRSVRRQHEAYLTDGSYENITVQNPTACLSLKVPFEGESISVAGLFYSATVTANSDELLEILKVFQQYLKTASQDTSSLSSEQAREDISSLSERLITVLGASMTDMSSLPFSIDVHSTATAEDFYFGNFMVFHPISDDFFILEAGVYDSSVRYVSYIAISSTSDAYVISILPMVTSEMAEIRPIVLESLPMIGAVVLLMVLLFSQFYSKSIVTPLERLVQHTSSMKNSPAFVRGAVLPGDNRPDEIGELTRTLEELYSRLEEQYQQLKEKNTALENENKRRELFLRSSSHQLKTPIAAALLLVDGMINQIGKYKDVSLYLPQVKSQLLSMRKIVEDVLYLSRHEDNLTLQPVSVAELLQMRLNTFQIPAADKGIRLNLCLGADPVISSDESLLTQILDNLLGNAVTHTPSGGHVEITLFGNCLRIRNYGTTIPDSILPHIFDPFVSGAQSGGDHGLGLYIASYYAEKLGLSLELTNGDDYVNADLLFT